MKTQFQWRLPVLLCAGYAVAFADRALVAVAGAPIKHDLGLSDSQFGLLSGSAFALLYCLCSVPLGALADRASRRLLITSGLIFWSVMTALCGLAHSFMELFIARIGVGLGEACLLPAGMSLLRDRMPAGQMGRAIGVFLMGSAIGSAIAHFAGGQLLIWLGMHGSPALPLTDEPSAWRALFLLATLPGLVIAAFFLAIKEPERPFNEPFAGQLRRAFTQLWQKRRAYGFLTGATACTLTLTQAPAAWLPLYYTRIFDLSPGESAMEVGLMVVVAAPLGQWVGGLLIDRFKAAGIGAAPNAVLALCAALSIPPAIGFCLAPSVRLSQASYVLFCFCAAAASPAGLAGWQALTPPPQLGLVVAILVATVAIIGLGLGPALIGFFSDHIFQDEQALGPAMLALLVPAGLLAPLLALGGGRDFQSSLEQKA